jgi:hypothetical protein
MIIQINKDKLNANKNKMDKLLLRILIDMI